MATSRRFRYVPNSSDMTSIMTRMQAAFGDRFKPHSDLKEGFAVELRDMNAGQLPRMAESFKGKALARMIARADDFGFTLLRHEESLAFSDSVTGYSFRLDIPGLQLRRGKPRTEDRDSILNAAAPA